MRKTQSGTWKKERASVTTQGRSRPHSNKYSKSDSHAMPSSGARKRVWVGGYDKADGTHVDGYYRRVGS